MSALVPTVSRWQTAANTVPLAMLEVCVSQAGMPSTLMLRAAPDDSSPALNLDHCPLCVLHASALGLPPQPPAMPLLNNLSDALPLLFLHAPRPPHVWAAALARAPPSNLA